MPELANSNLTYQEKLQTAADFWANAVGGEFVHNESWANVVKVSEGAQTGPALADK